MTHRIALLLAVVASTSLLGCLTRASTAAPPAKTELLLRSYDVPAGQQAGDVARIVGSLLANGGEGFGTARNLPGGRIAVLASEGVHEGVAELVEGLAAGRADTARTIGMTYWFVRGLPGEVAPRPDELRELDEPLSAIEQAQGATSFELLERIRVASVNNERAQVVGREGRVVQVVSTSGGTVVAQVELSVRNNRIEATVAAPPGRFVVLAEAGMRAMSDPEETGTLYVIVRSSLGG